MKQPLVSVVLCCYNGGKWLAQQIDSILRQTYSPLELIISDDGSTDNTLLVLQKYETHPAVRIFYQPRNIGLTRNFEFAAGKANGELIAFSDQDDIWLEHKIEKLVSAIGQSPLIYSDSLLVDENGNSMGKKLSDLKRMYTGNDTRSYILYSCVWGHTMLITKKLLQQSIPMPAEINHDIWIAYQAMLNGGIKYLNEVLTLYRQHPQSASLTIPEKNSIRVKNSRFEEYKKKLKWVELMQQHERPELQNFYTEFIKLYASKQERSYVFPLVSFMSRYRKEIFRLSNKGAASQYIEILKQARGEKQ